MRGAPVTASAALAVIAAGMGLYLLQAARVNDQPLELAGRTVLDTNGASAVGLALGGLVLFVAVLAAVAAWRGRAQDRAVFLSERWIEAPPTNLSLCVVRMAYARMTFKVEGPGTRQAELRGTDGEMIRLSEDNFSDRDAFDAFIEELGRRLALTQEATIW